MILNPPEPEPTVEELCLENPELDICPPTAEECKAAETADEPLEGCPPSELQCLLDPTIEDCPITQAECLKDPFQEACPTWEECLVDPELAGCLDKPYVALQTVGSVPTFLLVADGDL